MEEKDKNEIISKRIEWVDVARSLAVFCVISCHAVEEIYPFDLSSMMVISFQARIVVFGWMFLGRLGVPIFLVLTGYLLLRRNYDLEKTKKFWIHKCIPLLVTTEVWIFIYWLLAAVRNRFFDFGQLVCELLFLRPADINHLWYLPMILGIYVFIPIIANAINKFPVKILRRILVLPVIYLFLVPYLNYVFYLNGYRSLSSLVDLSYSGGIYGTYIILGYFLFQRKIFGRSWKWLFTILLVLLWIAAIVNQEIFYQHGVEYKYWYDSIYVFFMSVIIINLLSQIKTIPLKDIFLLIAKYSFGIYLIHNIILTLLIQLLPQTIDRMMKTVILTVLTFLLSFLLVIVISRIKKIRKILFFIK